MSMENMSAQEINELVWSDMEYKLKFILDNPNFQLPQIVRVVQGHMVDEDDALASGQVLTIHGKKRVENVIGYDLREKEVAIPISCPYKFKLISPAKARRFKGVKELCFCECPPEFIRLEGEPATGAGNEIVGCDVILQMKDHVLTTDGDVIGVNCLVDAKNKNRTITLPTHFTGTFIESLPFEAFQKQYTVSDLLKEQKLKLPVCVQFLPTNEKNCAYGPHLGTIRLERKQTTNSVLSTAMIENIRHALTFSADLPVTIQVAMGKKKVNNNNCMQSNVDLKRFDYCATSDPYTGVTMQNFDELRTPMLPRRENTRKAINHRPPPQPRQRSATIASDLNTKQENPEATQMRREKSVEMGRDLKEFEHFIKSRFGFENIRRSIKRKSKKKEKQRNNFLHDPDDNRDDDDLDDRSTYVTSVNSQSSIADIRSIGVTSSGSGSTCNDSFCTESTFDTRSIASQQRQRQRKNSGDSGIFVSRRKGTSRSISRSPSHLSAETQSNHRNDTCDSMSEWSIPSRATTPASGRKSYSLQKSSSSYLWSVDQTSASKISTNNDFISKQNSYNLMTYQQNQSETTNTEAIIQPSPLTTKHLQSMDGIRVLNEDGVGRILEELKLHEFRDVFIENQINGELLLVLEKDECNDLGLSLFQTRKIMKYVRGWRPENEQNRPIETSRRNSLNPRDWSENDVFINMTTLKLSEFGHFCRNNQVNGDLLLDILDKEMLDSLKHDHDVKINSLEWKKLMNYVVKGWRPDISPKLSAIL